VLELTVAAACRHEKPPILIQHAQQVADPHYAIPVFLLGVGAGYDVRVPVRVL